MSSTTFASFDVTQTPPVPFSRLVRVELRKLADTRAGRWLLISIVGLTLLVLVIQMIVVLANDLHPTFIDFLQGVNTSQGILLPVLGVLSVTSEWSQRTAMVTFTLEPSRNRVIGAKFVSTMIVALVTVVIGLVLGALVNVMYGALSGNDLVWGHPARYVFFYLLLGVLGMATGFAFGALFLNSPTAIVLYFVYSFVLPTIFGIAAALMHWFKVFQPWIDFNTDQSNLISGDSMSGKDWTQLVVAGVIWLAVPLAIGVWRILRAEVK